MSEADDPNSDLSLERIKQKRYRTYSRAKDQWHAILLSSLFILYIIFIFNDV